MIKSNGISLGLENTINQTQIHFEMTKNDGFEMMDLIGILKTNCQVAKKSDKMIRIFSCRD